MGVGDKPAEVGLLQGGFDLLDVGAFGQPDAARVAAEATAVMVAGDQDLGADRRGMRGQQGQQGMGGGAGDDLDPPLVLKAAKRADQAAWQAR